MSVSAFPAFVDEMKVFTRERMNGYYSVLSFCVSNFVASLPFIFLIALLSAVSMYFLAGLDYDPFEKARAAGASPARARQPCEGASQQPYMRSPRPTPPFPPQFVYFVLELFMSLVTVESLMVAIAPLVPHFLMGIALGALCCEKWAHGTRGSRPVAKAPGSWGCSWL